VILIFSKERDEFVNNVIDWLKPDSFFRIGKHNGVKCDSATIPDKSFSSAILSNCYKNDIDLEAVRSVWYNGGVIEYTDEASSPELNSLISQNITTLITGHLSSLAVKSIGNLKNNRISNKIENLLKAKSLRLRIPDTLITTRKEALTDFIETHKTGVICKRINDKDIFEEEGFIYDISKTFKLEDDFHEKAPDTFGLTLFQEAIEKEYEIRALFFNNTLYCAAIFDDPDNIDYRKNLNTANKPRIVPYILPNETEHKLKTLMGELNYTTASIDLIYSKNKDYVFLEINPSGQISFINNACNLYLETLFANYLSTF